MARSLRVEYPGAYYHVMNRGNKREDIFMSDYDRKKFLEYLSIVKERFSINIHTYCLMSNHYHLLLEIQEPNLSKAIKWLNGSYALYVNAKYKRGGHLFQGRFKSIIIEADLYLKELSRYIHLNPVRANMVETPSKYQWSSYSAYIGKVEVPEWLETSWLLSCFGKKKHERQSNYKKFVENIDAQSLENPAKDVIGGYILGTDNFCKWIKAEFLSDKDEDLEIPQLKKLRLKPTLDEIVIIVGEEFSVENKSILKKGLKCNETRDIAIYLAKNNSGVAAKELGTYFGDISGSAITMAYNRIEKKQCENEEIRDKLHNLKQRILNI